MKTLAGRIRRLQNLVFIFFCASCCSVMPLACSYRWKKSWQKSEEFLQGTLFFFSLFSSCAQSPLNFLPQSPNPPPLLHGFHLGLLDLRGKTLKWCELTDRHGCRHFFHCWVGFDCKNLYFKASPGFLWKGKGNSLKITKNSSSKHIQIASKHAVCISWNCHIL